MGDRKEDGKRQRRRRISGHGSSTRVLSGPYAMDCACGCTHLSNAGIVCQYVVSVSASTSVPTEPLYAIYALIDVYENEEKNMMGRKLVL
jgi:hypothetical protein